MLEKSFAKFGNKSGSVISYFGLYKMLYNSLNSFAFVETRI